MRRSNSPSWHSSQGFRGIDTANQRRHYHEAAVGQAIAASIASGLVIREELFLQTKFTFRPGHDHRLPYDPGAPVSVQVEQSFASSLEHLRTEYIDSYLLHGPASRKGLTPDDWAAWRAMEALHGSGRARLLGVSNVSLEQLELLWAEARPPAIRTESMFREYRLGPTCPAVLYDKWTYLPGVLSTHG